MRWSSSAPRPGWPIDICLDEVRESDLLVVIVGLKYGSLPPDMGVSYSQAKFEDWPRLAVQAAADLGHFLLVVETSRAKGVAEAPLREVLKRLGETEVAEAETPDRLARAADELLRLRADLDRLRNDRPEPLIKSDPDNAAWQRHISVSYEKIGDAQLTQSDFGVALNSYCNSRAIMEPSSRRIQITPHGNAMSPCRTRRSKTP